MNRIMDFDQDPFLDQVINAVPSGIFVIDKENNILMVNKAAAEMVGKSPGECFDRKCWDIFKTPMCNTEQCTCRRAVESNSTIRGLSIMYKDGQEIPIEYAARPLRNFEGNIIGCVEHFIDISERLEKERIIVKQQEELLKKREEDIRHLQEEILELSTPVIEVWDGVLALPLVGTLDSHRAKLATERLLDAIERTRSPFVIIDITGVPTVDEEVANHILQTVDAVKLMGSKAILTGISPHIARTMAQLGVDMSNITVQGRMSDALHVALSEFVKQPSGQDTIKKLVS